MKKWILISILMTTMVALIECSNHSRTVGTQVTSEEVFNRLAVFTSGGDERSKSFGDLAAEKGAVVYYSRAPGPFGQIQNVAAVNDFRALGLNVEAKNITDVEVFFLVSGDQYALLIAVKQKDHSSYDTRIFAKTDVQIAKAKFDATVSDEEPAGATVIHLKSTDVDPAHHLQGVIQLKLSNAEGKNIGKFPTLAGYAH